MPEMNGFEVLENLQKDSRISNIPVIMLTTTTETSNITKALGLGARDYVSKPFEEEELLARVKSQLELKLAQDELRIRDTRRSEELEIAHNLQASLFPTDVQLEKMEQTGFRAFVFHQSSSEVSGDMVCLQSSTVDSFSLSVVDCMGHGVGAGMMTMTVAAILNSLCAHELAAGEILTTLNHNLISFTGAKEPVVGINLSYSPKQGLSWARAAFPYPMIYRKNGNVLEHLKEGGIPLGYIAESYQSQIIDMVVGDKFLIASDGILEATNRQGEFLGISEEAAWHALVQKNMALPAKECGLNLIQSWETFRYGQQKDDATLVILEKI